MKKILLISVFILLVTAVFAKSGNPIPSYRVHVSHEASFEERHYTSGGYSPSDEKRDVNVSNDGSGGGNHFSGSPIIAYIYRLDHSIHLGPFSIPVGNTISIQIDREKWGVHVVTNSPTFVSVWMDDNN